MSTLSRTSTDQEVWESFDDNASYEEDASPAKAAAFITACRILMRRRPQSSNTDGTMITFETISGLYEEARKWLAANRTNGAGAGGVRHLDLSGVRD